MGNHETAIAIVELFDELLDRKGIEIPCNDKQEQAVRHDGNNAAKLYGMEFGVLVDDVENILNLTYQSP